MKRQTNNDPTHRAGYRQTGQNGRILTERRIWKALTEEINKQRPDSPSWLSFDRSNFPISRNCPCGASSRRLACSFSSVRELRTTLTPRPFVARITSHSNDASREFAKCASSSCGKRCLRYSRFCLEPTVVNT